MHVLAPPHEPRWRRTTGAAHLQAQLTLSLALENSERTRNFELVAQIQAAEELRAVVQADAHAREKEALQARESLE